MDMDTEDTRFETVCRLINKMLEQRARNSNEFVYEEDEVEELLSALEYYREAVDSSSGDIIIKTEYRCPCCGSDEDFRAQDGQVSVVEKRPEIGVEIARVHGITQCSECKFQIKLKQFKPLKLDGFNANVWENLYEKKYREREEVAKLQP